MVWVSEYSRATLTHVRTRIRIQFIHAKSRRSVVSWYFRCFWFSFRSSVVFSLSRVRLFASVCVSRHLRIASCPCGSSFVTYISPHSRGICEREREHSVIIIIHVQCARTTRWTMVDDSSQVVRLWRHRLTEGTTSAAAFRTGCVSSLLRMNIKCAFTSSSMFELRAARLGCPFSFLRAPDSCSLLFAFLHLSLFSNGKQCLSSFGEIRFLDFMTATCDVAAAGAAAIWTDSDRRRLFSLFVALPMHTHGTRHSVFGWTSVCVCEPVCVRVCILPTIYFLIVFIFMFAFWMPFSLLSVDGVAHLFNEIFFGEKMHKLNIACVHHSPSSSSVFFFFSFFVHRSFVTAEWLQLGPSKQSKTPLNTHKRCTAVYLALFSPFFFFCCAFVRLLLVLMSMHFNREPSLCALRCINRSIQLFGFAIQGFHCARSQVATT